MQIATSEFIYPIGKINEQPLVIRSCKIVVFQMVCSLLPALPGKASGNGTGCSLSNLVFNILQDIKITLMYYLLFV